MTRRADEMRRRQAAGARLAGLAWFRQHSTSLSNPVQPVSEPQRWCSGSQGDVASIRSIHSPPSHSPTADGLVLCVQSSSRLT